jgi:hypothetical protein
VDNRGFIKVQRSNALLGKAVAGNWQDTAKSLWESMSVYQSEIIVRPDFYICHGPKVMDFTANNLEQLNMLIGLELADESPESEVVVIAANIPQT